MNNLKTIYLAGGCFWGTEHYLKMTNGVVDTCTGFAETVRVVYDPSVLSLHFLIELYFKAIDPLSLNRQGEDEGTRYRTGIYYSNAEDLPVIKEVFAQVQEALGAPLAVEVEPLRNFYSAEEYHQDYLEKNPDGYCHLPSALFEFAKKANS